MSDARVSGAGPDWLRDLRQFYVRGLPHRLTELQDLLDRVECAPDDRAAANELAHGLHRLVGSARSHGFPEISETALDLSQRLVRTLWRDDRLSQDDLAAVGHGLERIAGLLES